MDARRTDPEPAPHSAGDIAGASRALRGLLGDRLATSDAIRRQHANTLTWIDCQPPDIVVWPDDDAEVIEIVRIAANYRVPLIPFGAGTSLEGHVNAPLGGISLDMSRMNRVLELDVRAMDCRVEAGDAIVLSELDVQLAEMRLRLLRSLGHAQP